MSDFLTVPITKVSKTSKPRATKTFALDFDKCRMTSRKIDGIEAVEQAIRKALITPRFLCKIYSIRYGSAIKKLISTSPTRKYLEASLENVVKDAIIHDERVLSIEDFKQEFDGDDLYISFTVNTVYGNSQIKERYSNV